MKIGTKSVLWGAHAAWFHPISVCLAWRKLYRRWPNWRELVAIIFHDTPGYWGKPNIDGDEGREHPLLGALWAARVVGFLRGKGFGSFDTKTFALACLHSRDYAKMWGAEPSALYPPDKLAIFYDPEFFYLWRTRLSGELQEFKQRAINSGHIASTATDREWLRFYKADVLARPEIQALLNK